MFTINEMCKKEMGFFTNSSVQEEEKIRKDICRMWRDRRMYLRRG